LEIVIERGAIRFFEIERMNMVWLGQNSLRSSFGVSAVKPVVLRRVAGSLRRVVLRAVAQ
jgi:hypothetical protein